MLFFVVFFYLGFLSRDIHNSQDSRGRERSFLIPLYNFHPLHEHKHISQAIPAESSPLHINELMAGLEPKTFGRIETSSSRRLQRPLRKMCLSLPKLAGKVEEFPHRGELLDYDYLANFFVFRKTCQYESCWVLCSQ